LNLKLHHVFDFDFRCNAHQIQVIAHWATTADPCNLKQVGVSETLMTNHLWWNNTCAYQDVIRDVTITGRKQPSLQMRNG